VKRRAVGEQITDVGETLSFVRVLRLGHDVPTIATRLHSGKPS